MPYSVNAAKRALEVGLFCFTMSLGHTAMAQDSVTMSADRTQVGIGETIQIQIRASSTTGQGTLELPTLPAEFRVVANMRSNERGRSQTLVQTFVLQAQVAGRFRIEPARLRVGGRALQSAPLSLRVTEGVAGQGSRGTPPSAQPIPSFGGFPFGIDPFAAPTFPDGKPAAAEPEPPMTGQFQFDRTAFLYTEVSDPSPYVGEQVTISTYLFVRRPLSDPPSVLREPTYSDFWIRQTGAVEQDRPHSRMVQGVPFQVYLFRQVAAFPLSAGAHQLGAMRIRMASDPFAAMWGGRDEHIERTSRPVELSVRELPPGQLPNTTAFVGTLSMRHEFSGNQVRVGEAVTLDLTLNAQGFVESLSPRLGTVDGLELPDPTITDELTMTSGIAQGQRRLRWLAVSHQPGSYTLGPVRYSVFDPNTETWSLVESPAFNFSAIGSAREAEAESDEGERGSPQFGALRPRIAPQLRNQAADQQPWYRWALLSGPALVALSVSASAFLRLLGSRRKKRLPSAESLASAKSMLKDGRSAELYRVLRRAINQVFEESLGLRIQSYVGEELSRMLLQAIGDNAPKAADLLGQLDSAAYGYGPRLDPDAVHREVVSLCDTIRKQGRLRASASESRPGASDV